MPCVGIGKIEDLFAGQGLTRAVHTKSDDHGMDVVGEMLTSVDRGLIFANLVDFDTQFGHRNDTAGYAANLERFDARLAALLPRCPELRVVTYEDPRFDDDGTLIRQARPGFARLQHLVTEWLA